MRKPSVIEVTGKVADAVTKTYATKRKTTFSLIHQGSMVGKDGLLKTTIEIVCTSWSDMLNRIPKNGDEIKVRGKYSLVPYTALDGSEKTYHELAVYNYEILFTR